MTKEFLFAHFIGFSTFAIIGLTIGVLLLRAYLKKINDCHYTSKQMIDFAQSITHHIVTYQDLQNYDEASKEKDIQ